MRNEAHKTFQLEIMPVALMPSAERVVHGSSGIMVVALETPY